MIDIKLLRKQKNFNQKDWGDILGGVNPPYISEVENGKRPVPEKWKKVLGEKFKINPEDITNSYTTISGRSPEDEKLFQELKDRNELLESMIVTLQKAIDALTDNE